MIITMMTMKVPQQPQQLKQQQQIYLDVAILIGLGMNIVMMRTIMKIAPSMDKCSPSNLTSTCSEYVAYIL